MRKILFFQIIVLLLSCEKQGDFSKNSSNETISTNALLLSHGDFVPTSGIICTGKSKIYRDNNQVKLELSEFSISQGPDLKVYLSKTSLPEEFVTLGIIIVEAFVIYFTINFAKKLAENKRIIKAINLFALFFFLLLAYLFFTNSNQTTTEQNYLENYKHYSPFFIGMILCGFNFLQIPFWLGWNLYLMNANVISLDQKLKFYYLFGILVGTFFGMLGIIYLLNSISKKILDFSKLIIPVILPLLFLLLAAFQGYRIYKKYFKIQTQ